MVDIRDQRVLGCPRPLRGRYRRAGQPRAMAGTRQGGGSLRKCAEASGCIIRGGATALAPRGALLIWRCLGGTGEAMVAFRVAAGRGGGVAAVAGLPR